MPARRAGVPAAGLGSSEVPRPGPEIIFLDALEHLQENLNLTVTHVLEQPPEDWEGETGLLTREIVERSLPSDSGSYDYMICGPAPMMDVAEQSLLGFGVPQRRILSERFNIV